MLSRGAAYAFAGIFSGFVVSSVMTAPAYGQTLNLQPGSGTQLEKFPTPRDPSYVPPLVPQSTLDAANESDSGSALIFASGGGGDLVSIFAERRRAQAEAARRADRYGERNAQYLDETGQDRALLEQNLLRQFGTTAGFPRDFGEAHYTETPGRRFSVIFFLSLPITSLVVGGLYQLAGPGVSVNGPADYPALFGIVGAGSVFSALIGYYDYSQTQESRAHAAGHLAREAYDLRNPPFGRRGLKDNPPKSGTDSNGSLNHDAPAGPPVSNLAPLYIQKAFRQAAELEARSQLRASGSGSAAGVTNNGVGARNFIREPSGSPRLGIRWQFQF